MKTARVIEGTHLIEGVALSEFKQHKCFFCAEPISKKDMFINDKYGEEEYFVPTQYIFENSSQDIFILLHPCCKHEFLRRLLLYEMKGYDLNWKVSK